MFLALPISNLLSILSLLFSLGLLLVFQVLQELNYEVGLSTEKSTIKILIKTYLLTEIVNYPFRGFLYKATADKHLKLPF